MLSLKRIFPGIISVPEDLFRYVSVLSLGQRLAAYLHADRSTKISSACRECNVHVKVRRLGKLADFTAVTLQAALKVDL